MCPSDAGTRLWAEGNSAWSPPAHRAWRFVAPKRQLSGGQSTTEGLKEQGARASCRGAERSCTAPFGRWQSGAVAPQSKGQCPDRTDRRLPDATLRSSEATSLRSTRACAQRPHPFPDHGSRWLRGTAPAWPASTRTPARRNGGRRRTPSRSPSLASARSSRSQRGSTHGARGR